MENGKQWFHSDSDGLHLLFEWFPLDANTNIWTGYLFVALLCTIERGITYYLDHKNTASTEDSSRFWTILRRTLCYGLATTLRLFYMLVVMYFNTGLFILVVLSLTVSQLFIEIIKSGHCNETIPLTKVNDNKRYNDLRSIDCQEARESSIEVEKHHGEGSNYDHSEHVKHYNVPKIVISNEKCVSTPLPEAAI